jgi:predicted RND superfamily exporter protein
MLERIVERSVTWATGHAKLVVALALALTIAAAFYTARTLTMDTDTQRMINNKLPWKQQMAQVNAAFPQNVGLLVVMIDSKNPDTAETAAAACSRRCRSAPTCSRPCGAPTAATSSTSTA